MSLKSFIKKLQVRMRKPEKVIINPGKNVELESNLVYVRYVQGKDLPKQQIGRLSHIVIEFSYQNNTNTTMDMEYSKFKSLCNILPGVVYDEWLTSDINPMKYIIISFDLNAIEYISKYSRYDESVLSIFIKRIIFIAKNTEFVSEFINSKGDIDELYMYGTEDLQFELVDLDDPYNKPIIMDNLELFNADPEYNPISESDYYLKQMTPFSFVLYKDTNGIYRNDQLNTFIYTVLHDKEVNQNEYLTKILMTEYSNFIIFGHHIINNHEFFTDVLSLEDNIPEEEKDDDYYDRKSEANNSFYGDIDEEV